MEIPKGFKKTEVGIIPSDWEVANLIDLSNMKSGESITSRSISETDHYPCYGGNGKRGFTTKYTHDGDYALIGRQGALCGNVQFVSGRFFASEHAVVVTPKVNTDIKWLYYVLANMNLNQYSESSAQPGLSVAKILNLPVSHPTTKAEQTAIATALNDADALITQLEKLIAKKRAIKQGAMQELLKPKAGWEMVPIGQYAKLINGRAYALTEWEAQGTPVIRLQNLTGSGENYYYSNLKLPEKQYCKYGDLLFMWSATFGPIIWKGVRAIYHYHIWKVETEQANLHKMLLYYLLSDLTERVKNNSTNGGTMLHITKKYMEDTIIFLPPTIEKQIHIAQILSDMDAEIEVLEKKLDKYKMLKQGMMQNLLTGKIRLI